MPVLTISPDSRRCVGDRGCPDLIIAGPRGASAHDRDRLQACEAQVGGPKRRSPQPQRDRASIVERIKLRWPLRVALDNPALAPPAEVLTETLAVGVSWHSLLAPLSREDFFTKGFQGRAFGAPDRPDPGRALGRDACSVRERRWTRKGSRQGQARVAAKRCQPSYHFAGICRAATTSGSSLVA